MLNIYSAEGTLPLRCGAEKLVEVMETPSKFLLFLTDSLHWLHYYQVRLEKYNEKNDHHYSVIVLIEEVINRWFSGDSDPVHNIAHGLFEFYEYCGANGMRELNNAIAVALGHYSMEVNWTSRGLRSINEGMRSLIDLMEALEEYECLRKAPATVSEIA